MRISETLVEASKEPRLDQWGFRIGGPDGADLRLGDVNLLDNDNQEGRQHKRLRWNS